MPLFRLDDKGRFVGFTKQDFGTENYERRLEQWIVDNPFLISEEEDILIIGRQLRTDQGKILDLLGVDSSGNTVVVEIKRGRTPRDVVAQAMEYAGWVQKLDREKLNEIALEHFESAGIRFDSLEDAMMQKYFPEERAEVEFNRDQRILIVGQEVSVQVGGVSRFLRDKGVDITCIEFSYYTTKEGDIMVATETVVGREEVPRPKHPRHKYSLKELLDYTSPEARKAFESLRKDVESLDPTIELGEGKATREVAFRYKGTNMLLITFTKEKFWVALKADKETFEDPKGWAKDIEGFRWGYPLRFSVASEDDREYAMTLIRQSFEFVSA